MHESHTVKTSYIFYQKYIYKAINNCDGTGGYRGLVGRANVGNRENSHISVSEKEARAVFKYHHIILKLPGEYKQEFVNYDNEKCKLFELDSINHKNVTTKFSREMKDVQRFLTKGHTPSCRISLFPRYLTKTIMHVLVWKKQFELWLVITDFLGLHGMVVPRCQTEMA